MGNDICLKQVIKEQGKLPNKFSFDAFMKKILKNLMGKLSSINSIRQIRTNRRFTNVIEESYANIIIR